MWKVRVGSEIESFAYAQAAFFEGGIKEGVQRRICSDITKRPESGIRSLAVAEECQHEGGSLGIQRPPSVLTA
jgi:hypothetical protein